MFNYFALRLCFLVILYVPLVCAFPTPVFLWGVHSESKPSLPAIKQNEFAHLLRSHMKINQVVAFLEANLTAQDFICYKPHSAELCYTFLRSVRPKTYYANVLDPLEALHTFAALPKWNAVNESGHLLRSIECEVGSIELVKLNSTLPTRAETLMKHDEIMENINKNIKCPVFFLYMSNTASIQQHSAIQKRMRRAEDDPSDPAVTNEEVQISEDDAPKTNSVESNNYQKRGMAGTDVSKTKVTPEGKMFVHNKLMIFVSSINIKDKGGSTQLVLEGLDVVEVDDGMKVVLETNQKPLEFTVQSYGGYHVIKSFVYHGVTYLAKDVMTPDKFSYACSTLSFRHMGTTLEFTNLQFQVLPKPDAPKRFYEAWHCTGAFSSAIISGIFVMTFVISIISCGVAWIMDIRSVDRFEDPQGKTIVITATD